MSKHIGGKLAVSNDEKRIELAGMRHPSTICKMVNIGSRKTDEDRANAHHIVKCWNNHEAMLNTLEQVKNWLDTDIALRDASENDVYEAVESILDKIKETEENKP